MTYPIEDIVLDEFRIHAAAASTHYADDTMREWDLAKKYEYAAWIRSEE